MIAWKRTAGIAHDIRYEEEDYVAQPGEETRSGFEALPSIQEASDPVAWAAQEQVKQEETDRLTALRQDARVQELYNKLVAATPQDISDWVDAQVTDLPSARLMFKRILVLMATQFRKGGV